MTLFFKIETDIIQPSVFRGKPSHFGTYCQFCFQKFPLVWSGQMIKRLRYGKDLLPGCWFSLSLLQSLYLFGLYWMRSHKKLSRMFFFFISLDLFFLRCILLYLSFGELLGIWCFVILYFPFVLGVISFFFQSLKLNFNETISFCIKKKKINKNKFLINYWDTSKIFCHTCMYIQITSMNINLKFSTI